MVIDNKILDELSAQAKASPRLRMAMDLRNSSEDLSQRMLNALEPGTVMPIHRHHASSESVVVLRGKIEWIFYDNDGNEAERVILDANGEPRMLNVERDRWHSLVCLEEGSVLYESKDGAYEPLREDEIMDVQGV
jgi:cupin fold WbuC family metalloprotein